MKTKTLYIFLTLLMLLSSCRTKKSSIDSNTKQTENVSVIDKSKTDKKETVQENTTETKTESFNEKQFAEMWLNFESDKITITDIHGTKTEITNPRINKKASQTNDVAKNNVVVAKNETTTTTEENKQTDVKIDIENEAETKIKAKDNRETKIVWLYWIGGAAIAISFMFLVNIFFKKSN